MWPFIEITNVIVETLFVLYFLNGIYHPVPFPVKRGAAAYIMYAIVLETLTFLQINPIIRILCSFALTFFICTSVYRSRIVNSIYVSLAFYVLVSLSDQGCLEIMKLSGSEIESTMSSGSARTMSIVVSKLIVLIGMQLIIRLMRRRAHLESPAWVLPLIGGQFVSILIADLIFKMSNRSNTNDIKVILAIMGLLYLNIVICFYVETIKQSYENKQEKKLAQQQLQMQIDYYEKMHTERQTTRALWHDIKKYILAMQTMLENEQRDEAYHCLQQAQCAIARIHQTVDVGNVIINGILEHALTQAQEQGIQIACDVWVPATIPITAVDLNIIMGNTIDNAIEACASIPSDDTGRKIEIVLKQQNRMLYYEIRNPLPSVKPKKLGSVHGYGLKNVGQCIEKYGGEFETAEKEGEFLFGAQIPAL